MNDDSYGEYVTIDADQCAVTVRTDNASHCTRVLDLNHEHHPNSNPLESFCSQGTVVLDSLSLSVNTVFPNSAASTSGSLVFVSNDLPPQVKADMRIVSRLLSVEIEDLVEGGSSRIAAGNQNDDSTSDFTLILSKSQRKKLR